MGRFIISRTAAGERFLLQSTNGQVLAVSKTYATLDACKKGIASLIVHAPIMPVRDLSAGEGGPNPKCEIVATGKGFSYRVKAANGKVVVFSGTYATKKACLRAIAMLRSGVEDYEILFERQAGLVPLVMKVPVGAKPKTDLGASQSPTDLAKTDIVGTGVLDCPPSPTDPVCNDIPIRLPKSLTKTKKAANGVENASFDLSALDEIEETAAEPSPIDLSDEKTVLDALETAKTTVDGAQNTDFVAKSPVGTGVPDCPPSPTQSAGNTTPRAPQRSEVKSPRLVRLTPERPKAPSTATTTPPRRKSIFDIFFKK